jgi:hypothetical protein
MGAFGALPENQKYVLTIEIPGPRTADEGEKVSYIVADLKGKFGASVNVKRTPKRKSKSAPKPKSKGKSKR